MALRIRCTIFPLNKSQKNDHWDWVLLAKREFSWLEGDFLSIWNEWLKIDNQWAIIRNIQISG